MGIILRLQQGEATATDLASRFEVSRRTILRDVQALSELGVPVYASPGRNGGYGLPSDYQMQPLHLNGDEALALLAALKTFHQYRATPFPGAHWTAGDKIRAALLPEVAQYVDKRLAALEADVPARNYTAPWLQTLMDHAADHSWVEATYRSLSARRLVLLQPRRVFAQNGFWYCEAHSHTHGEQRLFRVDRFETVRPCDPPPVTAADATPVSAVAKPDVPHAVDTRIKARLTYRGMVTVEADAHIGDKAQPITDDLWQVDFVCPSGELPWACRLFYSLGLDAEVLEPCWLRDSIREMAEQVARRYE